MKDEVPILEDAEQGPGRLARAALRVIDAGLRGLQGLRERIEAPIDAEDSGEHGRRKPSTADAQPAIETSAPPRKTLLHRFLVVVMCLLIGGVTGMLISYRGFSKQIDSQLKQIDYLQDENRLAARNEARNLDAKTKLQREISDYRAYLNEIQQESADYKRQIAELKARLAPPPSPTRPAAKGGTATAPATARPRLPQKTGTCVTNTENPSGNVLDCISKFNRP